MSSATVEFTWEPHHKQREVIESDARFRVLNWGRRTGKNEVAIVETIRYALENPDSTVWWVAPSYSQANDYGFSRMVEMLPGALVRGDPKLTPPREIELINDTVISFKSAEKPKNLKGAGVDYINTDEAASWPGVIWHEYLRPTLTDTLGGGMIFSTPKGKDWFYELAMRGQDESDDTVFYSHATSFDNPHVPDEEIEQQRKNMPERIFKQEYLAEFSDDSGEVFVDIPLEDYDLDSRQGKSPYRIGVDYARHHDWTVITVLDTNGYVVELERVQKTSWHAIQTLIENTYERYNPAAVQVDATRDNKITEDLNAAGIPVEPVKFTSNQKAEMVEDTAAMLESGEITIPKSAGTLRREMAAFEYSITSHGNVQYHAPEDRHDDHVDSLCLAATCDEPMSATWGR